MQLIGFFVAASMYAQTTIPTTRHRRRAAIRALSLGVLMVTFAVVWNYVTQPISIRTALFEIIEYLVGSMTAGGSDRDGLSESKRHE